jgi:hypothetical protein
MSENNRYYPPDILILMRHFHIGNKCHHTHIYLKEMKTAYSFKAPKLQFSLVSGGRAERDVKLKPL